jgi:hypothetical protein
MEPFCDNQGRSQIMKIAQFSGNYEALPRIADATISPVVKATVPRKRGNENTVVLARALKRLGWTVAHVHSGIMTMVT